jgi:hypothetical protein
MHRWKPIDDMVCITSDRTLLLLKEKVKEMACWPRTGYRKRARLSEHAVAYRWLINTGKSIIKDQSVAIT